MWIEISKNKWKNERIETPEEEGYWVAEVVGDYIYAYSSMNIDIKIVSIYKPNSLAVFSKILNKDIFIV